MNRRAGRARDIVGLLAMAVAVIALAPQARANITFGTTASGPLAYDSNNVYVEMENGFNPNLPAWVWATGGFEFTVPQEYELDSLTVPLRSFENTSTTMSLYSGGAAPQTLIETSTITIPVVAGFGFQLFTFDFSGTTVLHPGENYFLIGTVPQSTSNTFEVQWAGNSEGASVPFAYGETWLTGQFAPNGFLGWNTITFSNGPAWQINAQQVVPEPGSALLIVIGMAALWALKRGLAIRLWWSAAVIVLILTIPARADTTACAGSLGSAGCPSVDQNFDASSLLVGMEPPDVITTSVGGNMTYHFTGTVSSSAGTGPVTGTFTTNAAWTSVLSWSFNLSSAKLPFAVTDSNGYTLDNGDGYVNVFAPGFFQFQNLGFSHTVVLNLEFNTLPGFINPQQSSLLQAPNVAGSNWDFIGTFPSGQAAVPEPSATLLLGAGLMMLGLARRINAFRTLPALRGASANLKIADEQSSDHPSGR